MSHSGIRKAAWVLVVLIAPAPRGHAVAADVDLAGFHADCGVTVHQDGPQLTVGWPMDDETGQIVLDLRPGKPLVRSLGIAAKNGEPVRPLLENAEPASVLLVGSRQAPDGRPPQMSVFNVFFDSPANRPFETHASRLDVKHVRVTSQGHRATVAVRELSIGPFAGELRFTVYRGARLVHVEAVVQTRLDRRAILYDAGLTLSDASQIRFAWVDTEGKPRRDDQPADARDRHLAVRHRTLIAETPGGSVACFPPPHQYFSPRDLTDNLKRSGMAATIAGSTSTSDFGIRQAERGGGSCVPWFNAPPGTRAAPRRFLPALQR